MFALIAGIDGESMKTRSPINNWSAETIFKFFDDNYWKCWGCGKNHANCGHHIFGRGREEGCEKSPLNFAPMNNHECHLPKHGYWKTAEGKKKLFLQTINFLSEAEYTLTDLDNKFLEKYGLEIYKLGIKL